MAAMSDRVITVLYRRLDTCGRCRPRPRMHYSTRWDPFPEFTMLADVYHFPTQYFDFHHRQLSLEEAR